MKIISHKYRALLLLCLSILCSSVSWADYSSHPAFIQFAQDVEQRYQFKHEELVHWFSQAEKQDTIITAISKPAERSKTWGAYQKIFLTPQRIEKGVEFWRQHQSTVKQASETYQVSESIVIAIIGVETLYGYNTGKYRVIDALSTLAFDYPPRAAFFRSELAQFLLLARDNHLDPLSIKGSYAGAIGYSQFIPSSYRNFAVDMNADGFIDLQNPDDAIGSVAHYFQQHGWEKEGLVAIPAIITEGTTPPTTASYEPEKPTLSFSTLSKQGIQIQTPHVLSPTTKAALLTLQGDSSLEYWLALNNFYVITRYNHSPLYAMAVYQLSQALEAHIQQPIPEKLISSPHVFHKYQHR